MKNGVNYKKTYVYRLLSKEMSNISLKVTIEKK